MLEVVFRSMSSNVGFCPEVATHVAKTLRAFPFDFEPW
jgi:hypothetical protein